MLQYAENKLCVGAFLTAEHIVVPLSPLVEYIENLILEAVFVFPGIGTNKHKLPCKISELYFNRRDYYARRESINFELAIVEVSISNNFVTCLYLCLLSLY